MANVKIPYADPGRASFESLDTWSSDWLLGGSHPVLEPAFSYELAPSTVLAQFTVVGLNSSGKLVKAELTTPVKPIGVLAHATTSGASGVTKGPVWYSGCFNSEALVWDASYDTDAKKLAAFQGSPAPTTILITKRGL